MRLKICKYQHIVTKEKEFQEITDKQIVDVQNKLNNRPRKILGYKTPSDLAGNSFIRS
jgi:IS30 family transposase